MEDTTLKITKLPFIDTIIIKQRGRRFFLSTRDSIVIDTEGLELILRFLVMNDMLDHKVLERILDEHRIRET
jgi:hypothetical protein